MHRILIFVAAILTVPMLAASQTPATTDPAAPQVPQTVEERLRLLEQQVKDIQSEIVTLRSSLPAVTGAPAPAASSVPQPPAEAPQAAPLPGAVPAYNSRSTKVFNPDIGMIGNFLAGFGESRGGSSTLAPTPLLSLQESEASFQAVVDPFARADFFLALGEEGIEIEEGFVTFTSLPGGLLTKVGKMRANFGRLNAFHNHTLPWADRPLVMFNLLGGATGDPDTGIKDAGFSVSRLIPAGGLFIEATGEMFRGDSGTLFASSRRQDFSVVGRVRAYMDVTESANFEFGTSYARGHNDLGSAFSTQLYGADVTFRWRPLARAIYRSFAARSELIWSRREDMGGETIPAFGGFVSGDYQLSRRLVAGARIDWSERARERGVKDSGQSALLTYSPSEFTQIRGQYRRTRFGDRSQVANELLFQVLFTMGAHGAHAF